MTQNEQIFFEALDKIVDLYQNHPKPVTVFDDGFYYGTKQCREIAAEAIRKAGITE